MDIKQMKLSELTPYENNPRYNDEAVDKVAESIRQFGFNQPIVVDENNVIVVGHTRYRAAQELGLDEVPVYQLKGLSEEKINAYRIIDNKTSEFADWDWAALDEELRNITDVDMEFFGLVADDIDNMVEDGFSLTSDAKEEFSVSFVFPKAYEEKINSVIKSAGKDVITNEVMNMILTRG